MQRNKLNCACGWWQEGKCTRFSSDFEDYAQYKDCREDKYTCDQYEPLYNQDNIGYILHIIYEQSKQERVDKELLEEMYVAGHCCDFFGDYLYWIWPINTYILLLRNSSLTKKLNTESQIRAIDLMSHYGFKITKRMKRKYNRLKRQYKDYNRTIISHIDIVNNHLNGL